MKFNSKCKGIIKTTLSLIVCVLVILSGVLPAFADTTVKNASGKQIVKVGYFSFGEYYTEQSNGSIDSYDIAYLEKISEYTNLDFEYVNCGTWQNALKMLDQHQIDLLGTMQYTPERAKQYSICNMKYGVTYASIVARQKSNYVFEDYEAIGRAKIGYTKGYIRLNELKNMLKSKGISPTLIEFNDDTSMTNALNSGTIDMAAINSHGIHSDWQILEKYEYSPLFFASYKGNKELCNTIDQAILKIELYDSSFEERTLTKYFKNVVNDPFTKEEINYIKNKKSIDVYLETDTMPLSYYDEKASCMKGIFVDFCKMISDNTGINIECKPLYNDTVLAEDDLTVSAEYYDSIVSNDDGSIGSDSMLNCKFSLYFNKSFGYTNDSVKKHSVAVPDNRKTLEKYLNNKYPDYNVIECENPEECLKLVEEGQADYTFLNSYIANDIIATGNMNSIEEIPTSSTTCGMSLKAKDNSENRLLISILNKGIGLLNNEQCDEIVLCYAINVVPEFSLTSFVQNNYTMFILIIISAFIFCIIIATIIVRSFMLKKQQHILTQANNELMDASSAKTDFLSRMSHDIRTPMNAIIGLTDIALDRADNPEETIDCLQKIDSSSHFLLGLINDVLNMSKIENKAIKINSESYEYSELIRQVNIMFKPQCEEKGITLSISASDNLPECVKTDKVRFNQIIFNLISNSIKYTPEGGKISLAMRTISCINDKYNIEIVVSDNGVGMSKEFQKQMFEPFAQERKKHIDEMEGTGLGLAIVKSLVELMNGSITVLSEPGQGTQFTIVMPLVSCELPKRSLYIDTENAEVYLRDKTVLLCEDNSVNAQIAIRLLEKVGMKVELEKNGKDGVDAFRRSAPYYYDVVLMDIRMPIMDGLEATVAIRAIDREDAKTTPIIAMTANAFDEDRQRTLEAGMNSHIAKPIEPDMLYHTLAKFLS